jgi:hypothetical protein
MPDAKATETEWVALEGDELVDAVQNKHDSINERTSSYDQGRKEELAWVLSLIVEPEEEVADEEADATDDEAGDKPEAAAKEPWRKTPATGK